ncbi:hypothetical protein EYC84_009725 [Monilinia fructicola]|uniref:Uncharacterized protein n=1 Tax=Monilinia fructicola TaxID=38448 RepID=A0A5M9J8T1_MONFR|nr:hypothetical protein EYC84_009725 [Monilinia fructicola]
MKRSFPLSLNVIKNYQFYSSRTFSSSSLLQVKLHNINPSPSISHSSLSLRQLLSTQAIPLTRLLHFNTVLTQAPLSQCHRPPLLPRATLPSLPAVPLELA